MRVSNCTSPMMSDGMDNTTRFGRLNIGVTPKNPKAFNKLNPKDEYSLQVIYNDTAGEQDAVYLNGKRLGRLAALNGVDSVATADRVMGNLARGSVGITMGRADREATFPSIFRGVRGFFKGLVQSAPAMTVADVFNARKADILKRAELAMYASNLNFQRVAIGNTISYPPVSKATMDVQRQAVSDWVAQND